MLSFLGGFFVGVATVALCLVAVLWFVGVIGDGE
jgi:hypothetical protein